LFASILLLGLSASAAPGVMIETVPVGNPRNVPDSTGFGAVDYAYRIGEYEVTNAQYVDFLNANDPQGDNSLGLYNTEMTLNSFGGVEFTASSPHGMKYATKSGRAQKPVTFVSWFDAARFTNWLNNGQRPGETETGAYDLLGGTPIPFNRTVTRSANARWFLPSEDEWYKAAYYDNNGLNGGYWKYPTQGNSPPLNGPPPGDANSANYNQSPINTDHFDVGSYVAAASAFGTFDQAGNVSEWTDKLFGGACRNGPCERVRRGGSRTALDVSSSARPTIDPIAEIDFIGFRVATIVPEPHTLSLILIGFVAIPMWRRKPWIAG
jgi:formylglycine-generating enzyme